MSDERGLPRDMARTRPVPWSGWCLGVTVAYIGRVGFRSWLRTRVRLFERRWIADSVERERHAQIVDARLADSSDARPVIDRRPEGDDA
jgi:hypothetical protein